MRLRISNLGVIESMEIDLAKPFILFAGDNGTGKTYASTFLYCLIIDLPFYLYHNIFQVENKKLPITKTLKNGWSGILNPDELYTLFEEYLAKQKKAILEDMNLHIQDRTFKCEIITTKEEWREELKSKKTSGTLLNTSFIKKNDTLNYSIRYKDESLVAFTQAVFCTQIYLDNIAGTFFITAERNGIYTFSKELSVGRLRYPEKMADRRYPRPILDSLADTEDLANTKKRASQHNQLADDIERDILHGKLVVTDEGEIQFAMDEKNKLGINESSSAIKTLASVVFYLRHIAGTRNILFIDEPELNLHPKNQILLAKVFVKMINAGLRLVISTHSDYIIREINNMIMADALTKAGGGGIPANLGYDKSMCLSKDKFSPYLFETNKKGKVSVRQLEVDQYGFSMPSIDEAINRQNEVTDTLYEVLKYDYPNK